MNRAQKIRDQAEKLVKSKVPVETIIKQLYHNDKALSKELEEKDRASREFANAVCEETLKLHETEKPRETIIYKNMKKLYDKGSSHDREGNVKKHRRL